MDITLKSQLLSAPILALSYLLHLQLINNSSKIVYTIKFATPPVLRFPQPLFPASRCLRRRGSTGPLRRCPAGPVRRCPAGPLRRCAAGYQRRAARWRQRRRRGVAHRGRGARGAAAACEGQWPKKLRLRRLRVSAKTKGLLRVC